jgi:5-methylcytosine-specific restriction endonuclease McrBC regulatory subunit McrC
VLGSRKRQGAASDLKVKPDLVVSKSGKSFVVDAKYKTRSDRDEERIAEEDIYESLAFAKASNVRDVILVYPSPAISPKAAFVGESEVFEIITVDGVRIVGVHTEVRGISKRRGLAEFSNRLAASLQSFAVAK